MRISDWSSDVCSSDLVTVAAQKYPDPPISEARILRRQRLHRRNHRGIPGDLAPLVAQARSSYREKRASPANRETALPAIRHLLPTDRHAHHFFAATSFITSISRSRSATSFFRRAFSASSCFSRRRTEMRRVGKERLSTCKSRWSP